jgi:uncharacterized protein YndB with AHSA1/START domain
MPYTYTLSAIIPAAPLEVYEAWLDSVGHSEMTGGEAAMSDEVGAEVSAWGGYISGRNLELMPGGRIVQSWRTSEFDDEHEDSIVTITLEEAEEGTLLTLVHSNVPDEQRSYEEGGRQSNYFEPMVAYFGRRAEREETPLEAAAPGAAPQRAAKSPARTARKAKRAASRTSKRALPRKKAAAPKSEKQLKRKTMLKSTPGRAVSSRTRRPAKPAGSKAAGSKRQSTKRR